MTQDLEQTKSPELSEVLSAVISYMLAGVHTACPGVIRKWDAKTQCADVQPLLNRTIVYDDGATEEETLPLLKSVPVLLGPRSSSYFLSVELKVGDDVLLIMNERSIDEYFATSNGKTQVTPKDMRQHDLNDAVALPGFFTKSSAISDDIARGAVFGKLHGPQVRVNESSVEITTSGASTSTGGFVALAQLVFAWILVFDTVMRTTWVPVPQDGGAALKAAFIAAFAAVPTLADFASKNLKAD